MVRFPFGYIVLIKQVSDAEFDDIHEEEERTTLASWSTVRRTIYLRKRVAHPLKVYYLLHELGHAFVDWTHWVLAEVGLVRED